MIEGILCVILLACLVVGEIIGFVGQSLRERSERRTALRLLAIENEIDGERKAAAEVAAERALAVAREREAPITNGKYR